MEFVADEGVDKAIVDRLRKAGHDVFYIAEASSGAEDEVVLSIAAERNAVLITTDKDFGELVFRQGKLHSGVVLLRLTGLSAPEKAELLSRAVSARGAEFESAFAVLNSRSLRIRHLS